MTQIIGKYQTGDFETIFEGDPRVLKNVFNNPNNENPKIKPLLIAMSGVMRGVAGGLKLRQCMMLGFTKILTLR